MVELLAALFYLLRPALGVDAGLRLAGVDLLDLMALAFMVLLGALWLAQLAMGHALPLSRLDAGILGFTLWCLVVSAIYAQKVDIGDTAKFCLPMLSFVVLKSLLYTRAHFRRYLALLLIGALVPAAASALAIRSGQGLDTVNYWTGLPRYKGAYANTHDFGHNMAFALMAAGIYLQLRHAARRPGRPWLRTWEVVLLGLVVALGAYGLYQSYVRTAWIGLAVFALCFALRGSKKTAVALLLMAGLGAAVAYPLLKLVFHDVVDVVEGERSVDRIASGRPYIWSHNLEIFRDLTFDRQLAGVGIGNRVDVLSLSAGQESIWNSHNDYLEVMMQTGLGGLAIFLYIQYQLLRSILRLPRQERGVFLALFVAVTCMNFASNSYVVRFSIGQMLYMLLAYIESRAVYQPDRPAQPGRGRTPVATGRLAGVTTRVVARAPRR